jgi:TRAP transporter 4TM/12TM fusion protein
MIASWLVFGNYGTKKIRVWGRIYDFILAILVTLSCMYVYLTFDEFILRAGAPNRYDIILGIVLIVMVLEITRRTVGYPLFIVAIAFIAYGLYGNHLPGILTHRGYTVGRLVNQMFLTMDGIWGVPLGVAGSFVFLFILFGAFLQKANASKYITDAAYSVAGKTKGGPAKIAVISSGVMGTISGSSIANVVSTGSFTIPLMKSVGYRPHFAAAVEACSSNGGMLMPPVMGAAAFIMAEMTGVPYIKICIAAVIPALLYYISIFTNVHLEAEKNNLAGIDKDQLPSLKDTIKGGWHLIAPAVTLVFFLVRGTSPSKAAYMAIFALVLFSMLRKATRMDFLDIIEALELAAKNSLGVIAACSCAGITIGVVLMTGLGIKFASLAVGIAEHSFLLVLILTAIASLLLGMAVPPSASYIIVAILAAPALIKLGTPVLAANMFVFYNALLSDITPPVALCAYAAAGVADANTMRTGFTAMRIGIITFIVPFIFIYWPALLFQGSVFNISTSAITAVLGVIAMAAGFQGYFFTEMKLFQRILMFPAAMLLIIPLLETSLIGIATLGIISIWLYREKKAISEPQLIRKL